jgi:hypothetical protein
MEAPWRNADQISSFPLYLIFLKIQFHFNALPVDAGLKPQRLVLIGINRLPSGRILGKHSLAPSMSSLGGS